MDTKEKHKQLTIIQKRYSCLNNILMICMRTEIAYFCENQISKVFPATNRFTPRSFNVIRLAHAF